MRKIWLYIKKHYHTILLILGVIFFEIFMLERRKKNGVNISHKIEKHKRKITDIDKQIKMLRLKRKKQNDIIKNMPRDKLISRIRNHL